MTVDWIHSSIQKHVRRGDGSNYFHKIWFHLVDSPKVEVSIWGVISQMGEYRSQVVSREVVLVRRTMGLKQLVASEGNNRLNPCKTCKKMYVDVLDLVRVVDDKMLSMS